MLTSLSIDHHRADLAVLERIQQHTDEIVAEFATPEIADGAAMLTTCNRFEAYFDSDRPADDVLAGAVHRIARVTGIDHGLDEMVVLRRDTEVTEHLFAVSSGLESVVIGEGEIAGQVRRAIERSREAGTATSELERLFQTASRTSRVVKQRTGIQSEGRSLVRLALAMVEPRIGDWGSAKILLIGTGAYAGASLAALKARGAHRIGVFSPSGRAERFATSHGIQPVFDDELDRELVDADITVACSYTREPLITADRFARTRSTGPKPFCAMLGRDVPYREFPRPRLLIDMGVPRNIDPGVTEVPGVELIDLDLVAKHAALPELSAAAEARKIVADATAEFSRIGTEQQAARALVDMRRYSEDILQDELARHARGGQIDPAVEAALKHLTGRLLHRPTMRLREAAREGRASEGESAVDLLFGE